MVVDCDNKALSAVNDAGFNEIGAVGFYLDNDVRCLDVELLGVGDVAGKKWEVLFSCALCVVLVKVSKSFLRYAAVLKELLNIFFAKLKWLRIIHVVFDHLIKIVMNVLHDVVISILTDSILNNRIKDIFLLRRRNRSSSAKHCLDKLRLKVIRLLGEIEHVVDVHISFYKCREKKSLRRSLYYPVAVPVFNNIFCLVIAKSCLGKLDRANAAEDVVVDLV